ncbi:MAG: hypothetical protein GY822_27940 [Deltaproteobacteria bacterium]|nr:hypothetical protein [Deltaproteobacteria bacterium]
MKLFAFWISISALLVVMSALGCVRRASKSTDQLIAEQGCVKNLGIGDYNAAETQCQICWEFDEFNPECLNGLGLVWYSRGNDDKARSWLRRRDAIRTRSRGM